MSKVLEEQLEQFYDGAFPDELGEPLERVVREAQDMRIVPIPVRYNASPIGSYIASKSADPDGIYNHQALTADVIDRGENVFLGTGTK